MKNLFWKKIQAFIKKEKFPEVLQAINKLNKTMKLRNKGSKIRGKFRERKNEHDEIKMEISVLGKEIEDKNVTITNKLDTYF